MKSLQMPYKCQYGCQNVTVFNAANRFSSFFHLVYKEIMDITFTLCTNRDQFLNRIQTTKFFFSPENQKNQLSETFEYFALKFLEAVRLLNFRL